MNIIFNLIYLAFCFIQDQLQDVTSFVSDVLGLIGKLDFDSLNYL